MGANLDGPEARLSATVDLLEGQLSSLRVSPLYRTAPVSRLDQPPFFNAAVTGVTDLEPEEVLALGKALEWAAGRRRGPRFGPRPLDVDLLVHGDCVLRTRQLTVPHPRLAERRFYLEPLARIAPSLIVPPLGVAVAELLRLAPPDQQVLEVPWPSPPGAFSRGARG